VKPDEARVCGLFVVGSVW